MKLSDWWPSLPRSLRRRLAKRAKATGLTSLGDTALQQQMQQAADTFLAGLPSTVFHCSACGTNVGRYNPNEDARWWRLPERCPKCELPLEDPGIEEWRERWTRRGKPETFNLYLNPVQ